MLGVAILIASVIVAIPLIYISDSMKDIVKLMKRGERK